MPANSDLVRCAGLLWLDIDNEWRREEGAAQDEFSLLTREGAGHPAGKELLLQIVLYFVHIRVGRRVIGQDNGFCQCGHVSKRETVPKVLTKKRVSGKETMFREEEIESVWVVRMWNAFKDRAMLGSREGGGETRNNGLGEVGVRERKGTGSGEKIFRRSWGGKSRRERGGLYCHRRSTCGGGPLYGGRRIGRGRQVLGRSS